MRNEKIFDSLAWWFHKRGVHPNHLTLLQAPVYAGLAYVGFLAHEQASLVWAFAALQVLVVALDGADGILARRTGTTTRRGHLLDSLFDILGIGITLAVVAYLYPYVFGLAFALLLVNFLVYIQNEIQGTKSVTYTRGPATLGLLLEPYTAGILVAGLALPLAMGLVLMVTRVEWRRRLWNWYQFLSAGRRREYKAVPRTERAALARAGEAFPPAADPGAGRTEGPPEDEDERGSAKAPREATSPSR